MSFGIIYKLHSIFLFRCKLAVLAYVFGHIKHRCPFISSQSSQTVVLSELQHGVNKNDIQGINAPIHRLELSVKFC